VKQRLPSDLQEFVAGRDGVDAIVQRIGRDTWDLVLIDGGGNWTRAVFHSDEVCKETAKELGIADDRVHEGWDDESIAKRMTRRDHWNAPGGQRRAL
jgi:hypothetical protein